MRPERRKEGTTGKTEAVPDSPTRRTRYEPSACKEIDRAPERRAQRSGYEDDPNDMRSRIARRKLEKEREEREAERRDPEELKEEEELGSPCFSSRIRRARKPKRFKFAMETPKYDGTQEPEAWLDDYLTAVKFQKGTQTTAMHYIQLQMVGAARSGLKSRRRGIYDSWEQFSDDFIRSFRSTCRWPVTIVS